MPIELLAPHMAAQHVETCTKVKCMTQSKENQSSWPFAYDRLNKFKHIDPKLLINLLNQNLSIHIRKHSTWITRNDALQTGDSPCF